MDRLRIEQDTMPLDNNFTKQLDELLSHNDVDRLRDFFENIDAKDRFSAITDARLVISGLWGSQMLSVDKTKLEVQSQNVAEGAKVFIRNMDEQIGHVQAEAHKDPLAMDIKTGFKKFATQTLTEQDVLKYAEGLLNLTRKPVEEVTDAQGLIKDWVTYTRMGIVNYLWEAVQTFRESEYTQDDIERYKQALDWVKEELKNTSRGSLFLDIE